MSGAGLGGAAGTALGLALAPETGGMSLLIPALAGAAGSAAGGYLTGSKNIGRDAIAGGIGGAIPGLGAMSGATSGLTSLLGGAGANGIIQGLGGALSGGVSSGGDLRTALLSGLVAGAGGAAMTPGAFGGDTSGGIGSVDPTVSMAGEPNITAPLESVASSDLGPITQQSSFDSVMRGLDSSAASPGGIGGNAAGSAASPGILSKLMTAAAKNPVNTALALSTGLSAIDSFLPKKSVDVAGNANSVFATNPNFTNPNLPAYHVQNDYTPYTGSWYTYGQQPNAPMLRSQIMPGAKEGGLVAGYSHGGQVKGYAMGGGIMPPAMPQGQPPQQSANPLAALSAYKLGHQIGSHLKQQGAFTGHGQVKGAGTGQSDSIPAKLSKDEFVLPADIVSALGDGSSDAGGEKLKGLINNVRKHKATKGFPPRAKNPLKYLPKGAL